jgi:hypothetical protein
MHKDDTTSRVLAALEAALRLILIRGKKVHLYRLGFLQLREEPFKRHVREVVGGGRPGARERIRIERGEAHTVYFEKCEDPTFLALSPRDYDSEADVAAVAFSFLPERLKFSLTPAELVAFMRDTLVDIRARIDGGELCLDFFDLGSLIVNPSRSAVKSDFFGQREISLFMRVPIVESVREVKRFNPPTLFYFFELFEAAFGAAQFKTTAQSIFPNSKFLSELSAVVISAWRQEGATPGFLYVTDGVRQVLKTEREYSVFLPEADQAECPLWPALSLVRAIESQMLLGASRRSSTANDPAKEPLVSDLSTNVIRMEADAAPLPGGAMGFLCHLDPLLPGSARMESGEAVELSRLTPLLPEELQLLDATSAGILEAVLREKKILGVTSSDRRPVTLRGLSSKSVQPTAVQSRSGQTRQATQSQTESFAAELH